MRILYKVPGTQIYIILNSGKLNPSINGTSFETKNKIQLVYIIVMINVVLTWLDHRVPDILLSILGCLWGLLGEISIYTGTLSTAGCPSQHGRDPIC